MNIGLVGKAITFDTGGISIKPSREMWIMKGDMAGGAAVLGAMRAIAQMRPNVNVTAIVPSAPRVTTARRGSPPTLTYMRRSRAGGREASGGVALSVGAESASVPVSVGELESVGEALSVIAESSLTLLSVAAPSSPQAAQRSRSNDSPRGTRRDGARTRVRRESRAMAPWYPQSG